MLKCCGENKEVALAQVRNGKIDMIALSSTKLVSEFFQCLKFYNFIPMKEKK